MEYSLQNLNQVAKLKNISLKTFLDQLNLLGLEIDNIFFEKISTNPFLEGIKIEIKIPANRQDLLAERILIYELSSLFGFEIYEPWKSLKQNYSLILNKKYNEFSNVKKIIIESELNSVFTYSFLLENLDLKRSPEWIIKKLAGFGITNTNNLNDILQLVYVEWGQMIQHMNIENLNLNTFEQLDLQIESLKVNEFYYDLENNSYKLLPGTIVLKEKNTNKIVSVLGLFNINFKTTENNLNYLIEGTFYDSYQNDLNLNTLNTKLSFKYLKRSFLENFKISFQRTLTLFEIITSSKISSTKYFTTKKGIELKSNRILKLTKEKFVKILNLKEYDPNIFIKLGINLICETKKDYFFKIPFFRKDLERQIDLIEEYSKFIGYKNFPEVLPKNQITFSKKNKQINYFIKRFFLNYGFFEILTNSLTDSFNAKDNLIKLTNPLNNEVSHLRKSLIPKLLDVFFLNLKVTNEKINFFEIGRVFKNVNKKLIEQEKFSGIFQISNNKKSSSEWFLAKGFIENFLYTVGHTNLKIKKIKAKQSFFHPTRSIIFLNDSDNIIGIFGEVNPKFKNYENLKNRVYIFEFNLLFFKDWQLKNKVNVFKEYTKISEIVKDLSFVFPINSNFNELKNFIKTHCKYLKKTYFFDVYFDTSSSKSVSIGIRFEFEANNDQITNEKIEGELENIKKLIFENFLKV